MRRRTLRIEYRCAPASGPGFRATWRHGTPFLDALIAYWGTVSDLLQRQEHGAQREGHDLVNEDARRVVFHTCLVIYELDRAITRR
jgi:hypothetical protein